MEIGLNNSAVKANNIGLVLQRILTGAAKNRSAIANQTGLTKMTVSNIVGELLENKVLLEKAVLAEGRKGRPSIDLCLSPAAPKILGIGLFEKTIQVSLLSLQGEAVKVFTCGYPSDETGLLSGVFDAIDGVIRSVLGERIIGFSVIGSGVVSQQHGSFITHANPIAVNVKLKESLVSRYKLPVFISDNAEAIGTFEHLFGVAKESNDFLYISLNEILGSTIFVQGKALKNSSGTSPDLGHVSIDYNGLSCTCGNRGCLQSYIAIDAMEKKLRDITKLKADFKGFCDMQAKKNDARIDWALKDMMDKLGFALVSVGNIVNPRLVIIGGKGRYIPDRYIAKLEKTISGKFIIHDAPLKVIKSKVDEEETCLAAIAQVIQAIGNGELAIC